MVHQSLIRSDYEPKARKTNRQGLIDLKNKCESLANQLIHDRSVMDWTWKKQSEYMLPYNGLHLYNEDEIKPQMMNKCRYDSTVQIAIRTATSGLGAGMAGPSIDWVKLKSQNEKLQDNPQMKEYLHYVNKILKNHLSNSDFYNIDMVINQEALVHGTGLLYCEPHPIRAIIYHHIPVGLGYISGNSENFIDKGMRIIPMTIRNLVDTYCKNPINGDMDFSNLSEDVRKAWIEGGANREKIVKVKHIMMPNDNHVPKSDLPHEREYIGVHYESGSSGYQDFTSSVTSANDYKILGIEFYKFFPLIAKRWSVIGNFAYGLNSPGMISLPEVVKLNKYEKGMLEAHDKMINPPMMTTMAQGKRRLSILPKDISYLNQTEGPISFQPVYQVDMNYVSSIQNQINNITDKVNNAFFVHLFLAVINKSKQMTATEIARIQQEHFYITGPYQESANRGYYSPSIEIAFDALVKVGAIPPPPENIQGQNLEISYESTFARAQKSMGLIGIKSFLDSILQYMQIDETAGQAIDTHTLIKNLAEMEGVPQEVIRNKEEVMVLLEKQQAQKQAMMDAQLREQDSKSMKNLAGSKTDEQNMLNEMKEGEGGE